MTEFWQNILVELIILVALGLGYYFFQRNRILRFEANRIPYLYSQMLQILLVHKDESIQQPHLDSLIIKIDDFVNQTTDLEPKDEMKSFLNSAECTPEIRTELKSLIDQM